MRVRMVFPPFVATIMENIWAIIIMLEKWKPCCILLKPMRAINVLIAHNIDGVRAVHTVRAKAAAKRRGLGVDEELGDAGPSSEEPGGADDTVGVEATADITPEDVVDARNASM